MKIPAGMLSLLAKPKGGISVNDSTAKAQAPNPEAVASAAAASTGDSSKQQVAVTGQGQTIQGTAVALVGQTQDVLATTGEPVLTDGERFRNSLNELDSLLTKDFDAVSLALSRDIVKRVMIELRTHPEYNGIVQDGDIRNVFIFLRRAVERAKESGSEKVEKKTKKAAKAKEVVVNVPDSIEMLGGMDFGAIAALMGPKK